MNRQTASALVFLFCGFLLFGCADTPKEPVLRPIPPPPAVTPPGPIVYVPPGMITSTASTATTSATSETPGEPSGNYEVLTNVVGNAQTSIITGPVQNMTFTNQVDLPQFEMVPPRPGPNFEWQDGFWQWQGTAWVWAPGQWIFSPPSVVVVPQFHAGWYFGPGPYWRHGPPPRHWRHGPPGPRPPRLRPGSPRPGPSRPR